jgi:hypothetical protein
MSLTRAFRCALLVVLAGTFYEGRAHACLSVKCLAGEATEGAVEKVEPALARTIADVDGRLATHEERIGNIAGGFIGKTSKEVGDRLSQVDGILEQRLLQVQLGVDSVLDHGLDKIDGVARSRIAQIDQALASRIRQIGGEAATALSHADEILKNRIGDVGRVVTGAIDQADGALGARIEQLDEVAGRRLGNVDVIATKQRLGLELTITRTAWLLGLIVFVVVVLRSLWTKYCDQDNQVAIEAAKSRKERAALYFKQLGLPLLRHAVVAGVVAGLLALVPERLPMAAAKEQRALVQSHAAALENSVFKLDWTRVKFHASQLEYLDSADSSRYQVLAAKADLLRDLLGRPTVLATSAGVDAILDKVRTVERLQPGRPDPDAVTVRAMIGWQRAKTKLQEYEAASLASQALWSNPRDFTLGPMARLIVEAYLHAPAPADSDKSPPLTGEGLAATLDLARTEPPGSPFEGIATLFHLMQALDEASSAAYVRMVEAQSMLSRLKGKPDRERILEVKRVRNQEASEVVVAWERFDNALRDNPNLSANPLVLSIFRLNDVLLTHALWFTTQPETAAWPKKLGDLTAANEKALKLAIAPARVVWARRYAALLQGPAQALVEVQEAQRFEGLEQETLAFEKAYEGLAVPAAATPSGRGKNKASPAPADQETHRLEAARAAAALDLYDGKAAHRTPLAVKIAGSISDLQKKAEALVAGVQGEVAKDLRKTEAQARQKITQQKLDTINALRALLIGRGPRLI